MSVATPSTPGHVVPSTEIEITPKLLKRFWEKVKKTDGCWEWAAAKSFYGYGVIGIGKKVVGAHRVSFLIHNGPFGENLSVCHRCDNPACVRPEHLFLGTQKDNMQDMMKKGRYNEEKRNPQRKRGADFWSTKLTPEDVAEIRRRYVPGIVGQRYLAKMFGVTKNAISLLLKRITWRHVP